MRTNEISKILIYTLVLAFFTDTQAQDVPADPKKVAILLYQGVELLDFAGPGEVFSAAGFSAYTVSVDGEPLTSQGFVTVQPQFSIETAPTPDIIVFPGGSAGETSNNPKIIAWIKKLDGHGAYFMSVCTGAFILARAGLLDNKRVTTHWGSTTSLEKVLPTSTVMEDTRFVDNGRIITTAGVSAGIDGALHFVSRIKGIEVAKKTARYMEYEKWNPNEGLVDNQNVYLQELMERGVPSSSAGVAPFQGEFSNLALALYTDGQFIQAEKVLKDGIRLYPESVLLYSRLSEVYLKLAKPVPTASTTLVEMVRAGNVKEAMDRIERDQRDFPGWKICDEIGFNDAGYYLLYEKNDIAGAIAIFELNVREFPNSSNAYDSLAEAYLKAGKKELAIDNYKKSLLLDERNEHAKKILAEIAAN